MNNKIESPISLLERPNVHFADVLYETKLNSRDPKRIRKEWKLLIDEGKKRKSDKNGTSEGYGTEAVNNLFKRFNYRDPKTNMVWREWSKQFGLDYYEEQLKTTFRQSGQDGEHTDLYLDKTREEFYADIDKAAEEVGLNPEEDIANVLRITGGTDAIHANEKFENVYVKLRSEFGYNHVDLSM